MGVPYESEPISIEAVGGVATTIVVEFPGRSHIQKIIVSQISGVLVDFTIELFNYITAMPNEQSESLSDPEGDPIPLDCYRICSPLSSTTPGRFMHFTEEATGGQGYMFFCRDKNPGRQGQIMRNLYLRITPAGSGPKTFVAVVGGEAQIAGV